MKNILIIGAGGQIGSELTMRLRKIYGNDNVVASDLHPENFKEFMFSGPTEQIDVTNSQQIADVVKKYKIDAIYNLAALLSAVAEKRPMLCWDIGLQGHINILEIARKIGGISVFFPSSIGAFGPSTPAENTPQDTIQRPNTIYGVTKVTGELLSDYYFKRFGVDTRGVRFPGIISNVTLPGGGTTDYAVEIYYEAMKNKKFVCPLDKGTFLDMLYMPDALDAAINLMEADSTRLIHRNCFNVSAMSFDPEIIAAEIKKHIPEFQMSYDVEPIKQGIANTWPNSMDDIAARKEWDWNPKWNLENMTTDMLAAVKAKIEKGEY